MWRRVSSQLRAYAPWRAHSQIRRPYAVGDTVRCAAITANKITARSISGESASATRPTKPRVEDILPIATGLEREEMEAELQGKKRFDMDAPVGPFGTKEAPAVIHSYYNKRIVGCSGGEGEDEHDVVWFWLEKSKPHECPVCSQYFTLEVVGPGGPPDGHGDDHHHH